MNVTIANVLAYWPLFGLVVLLVIGDWVHLRDTDRARQRHRRIMRRLAWRRNHGRRQ